MGGKEAESCGRCAMSSTASLLEDADPYEGDRIELPDPAVRAASPAAWLAGAKRRLDDWATRLTYDR